MSGDACWALTVPDVRLLIPPVAQRPWGRRTEFKMDNRRGSEPARTSATPKTTPGVWWYMDTGSNLSRNTTCKEVGAPNGLEVVQRIDKTGIDTTLHLERPSSTQNSTRAGF